MARPSGSALASSPAPVPAQRARLARAGRPDETDEPALLNREVHSFEDRLPAIGNGQIADPHSAPCDGRVVQPRHARTGLDEPAGDQALLDAPGRIEVDADRFRVETVAMLHDNAAKLLEVEPGRHLLG